jgi:GNAT superfamily N-acetyltransferase
VALTYFKRFRMEIDLAKMPGPFPALPEGYRFRAWSADLLPLHAAVKYQSFRMEVDANVFPCLGDPEGCHRLMTEITRREGFLPQATWLIESWDDSDLLWRPVATIQGVRDREGNGSIQNLGVVPEARSAGIGQSVLLRALYGYREVGINLVSLEVTAQNTGAIRLYERMGFHAVRTVYKAVELGGIQTLTY